MGYTKYPGLLTIYHIKVVLDDCKVPSLPGNPIHFHVTTTWACCAALYSHAGQTDSTDRSYSKCHRVLLPLQLDWRDGYVPMGMCQ